MLSPNIVENKSLVDSKKAKQVSDAFSFVLNDNGADVFHDSRKVMNKVCGNAKYKVVYVAVGYHDKDRNEYGDLKTPHYHLVIEFEGRMQLLTCFNWLVDLFCCNENQVQIEKCNDVGAQTRYILHLDNVDKYQYKGDVLVSNNFEKCEYYLDHIYIKDEKHLCEVIMQNPSRMRLLQLLGEKQYRKWRFAITDIVGR